jgi:hypothetical protein
MKHIRILISGLVLASLSSCDRQQARMSEAAEKCDQAVHTGALEAAETLCTLALGEQLGVKLKPAIRAERLLKLGKIKRSQANYAEARLLVAEFLSIREDYPGSGNTATASGLLEMSLILAGQKQWTEGARYLLRAISSAGQLDEKDTATLLKTHRLYVGRVEIQQDPALAAELSAAIAEIPTPRDPDPS